MNVDHEALGCEVLGLSYDFVKKIGSLAIAANQSADVMTARQIFEAIDRSVWKVNIIAGAELDFVWVKLGGQWVQEDIRSARLA